MVAIREPVRPAGRGYHRHVNIIMPEICGYQTIEKIRQRKGVERRADHRPDRQSDEGYSEKTRRTISPSRPHTAQLALRMCCIARRDRP